MSTDIVTATMRESLAEPEREATLRRLQDWRQRVHTLYDDVQAKLGPAYHYDRTGKNRSLESRVQRAGLTEDDVPPVDVLRIEFDGRLAAQFLPRMLWMIGGNGRLDLVVSSRDGAQRFYTLIDQSLPFSNRSVWRLTRPSDSMASHPFCSERFHELLE
ncbi:MAG TPA: hypothetical protein VGG99_03630 [Acetobacteraceae bacterium]|jgi:hypothetical protein